MFLNICASSSSSLKVSLGHWWVFLNCYLAYPRLTLSHYWGDSLTLLMVITTFLQFWLECQGTLEWGWVPKPGDYPWGLNRWPINSNYNALTHKGFLHYGVSVLWIYCMCVRSFHHVWFKILHFSSLAQHRWYNLRKSKEAYLISFKVSS